eukprot:m.992702 g.992702  ORF g.992702 m.992702 type:complete len:313 (+) comp24007_c0_seq2:251-1189(+)
MLPAKYGEESRRINKSDGFLPFRIVWKCAAALTQITSWIIATQVQLAVSLLTKATGVIRDSSCTDVHESKRRKPSAWKYLLLEDMGNPMATDVLFLGEPLTAETLVVLVPGNPGNASFYEEFLEHIYELSEQQVSCVCFSHLGHSDRAPPPPGTRIHFEDQVEHAARTIALLQRRYAQARVVLVGHSIGSRMVLESMGPRGRAAGLAPRRVARCILLFPTLSHLGTSPNGSRMYPLLACHDAVAHVVALLWALAGRRGLRALARARLGQVCVWCGVGTRNCGGAPDAWCKGPQGGAGCPPRGSGACCPRERW